MEVPVGWRELISPKSCIGNGAPNVRGSGTSGAPLPWDGSIPDTKYDRCTRSASGGCCGGMIVFLHFKLAARGASEWAHSCAKSPIGKRVLGGNRMGDSLQ